MKRRIYTQLESDLRLAQADAGRLHCALNDLLNDRQTWFRKGRQRLGVSRENGAEGGLVIHRYMQPDGGSYSSTYSWEDWWPPVRDNSGAIDDKDWQDLRSIALEAHNHILRIQTTEKAA